MERTKAPSLCVVVVDSLRNNIKRIGADWEGGGGYRKENPFPLIRMNVFHFFLLFIFFLFLFLSLGFFRVLLLYI